MPWKESYRMSERMKFILRLESGERMIDLCREFRVSRKTGYKFLDRYKRFGAKGLFDESRAPIVVRNKTPDSLVSLIVNLKREKTTWGAAKIREILLKRYSDLNIPCVGTIHNVLDRNGLTKKRDRKRPKLGEGKTTLVRQTSKPNQLWCADFKGQFKIGTGAYCYPLTITDHFSRYLLCCEGLEGTEAEPSMQAFEMIFREYGLPDRIRTDNGCPFAYPRGLFGLSKLSIMFLKLGIGLERIEPGHPEQNGRHERMHLTLKQSTTRPAAPNMLAQQERFDYFRSEFNCERPHEALNLQTPASLYSPSARPFPDVIPNPEYPLHDLTLRVYANGYIHFKNKKLFYLSKALEGEVIGLREEDQGIWRVSFLHFDLGFFDINTGVFSPSDHVDF